MVGGAGNWNAGAWNTPRTTSQITLDARLWSINNWGEDLIITQKDGETFEWNTSAGMTD